MTADETVGGREGATPNILMGVDIPASIDPAAVLPEPELYVGIV